MARRALIAAMAAALLLTGAPATATPAAPTIYSGQLGGARYQVEVPPRWNGTLLLWSHGAYAAEFPPGEAIDMSNHPATRQWLLDNGYALAASRYAQPFGWLAVESGLRDQRALLDWFTTHVGTPRRTVSWGASAGGLIATLLAERDPGRFAGVASLCGALGGTTSVFNSALDFGFALKTLLAPDLRLVDITDPAANTARIREVLDQAMASPEQRARLALAAGLADTPGWFTSRPPRPASVEAQIRHMYLYGYYTHAGYWGQARADLEQRAGGNPSWNTGVDYTALLANSSQRTLVEQSYRDAGLDLDTDLRALAAAPRIAPTPRAVAYTARNGTPRGHTPWPVITLHTTGDGSVAPEHASWYGGQVRDQAKLRQVWVDRGYHCTFTAAEEIATVRTLLDRMETGRWGEVTPQAMNGAAGTLGPEFHTVWDWNPEPGFHADTPRFTAYAGGTLARPGVRPTRPAPRR
ncbi:alpha/beta fold hydrolase [Actinokineospora sp. HUAS TT18]|uniref:alpha/beta fold hydrolase n=1 Tax=Actinokineospora sp. HUAS TT18 TaxID=3447451 RepID=UPI003F51B61C